MTLVPGGLPKPRALLLSVSPTRQAKARALEETAFADGLRGIAALFVVSSHVVLCYARGMVNACCSPDGISPSLFQRPILRLPAAGHSWVAIFFVLMGFVNALKPVNLARAGQLDRASVNLTQGAFGRICRLIIPATIVTALSWFLCQIGLYQMAGESDAYWLYTTTPSPSPSFLDALQNLGISLRDTWMFGRDNPFDQPQWALIHLLQGSMMIITALVVTVNLTTLWRTISLSILVIWSIDWSETIQDPWVGPACFLGIMLAEFCLSPLPASIAPYSPFLTPPLAIVSLIMMSYTKNNPQSQPWSRVLFHFGSDYLPGDPIETLDRTYGSIGGVLLLASIIISPHARWVLSRKPLKWLGKVSFAIYLVHGTILRTIFAWAMFGGVEKKEFMVADSYGFIQSETRYPVPGPVRCALATMVAFVAILVASQLWHANVEPAISKITKLLGNLVTGTASNDQGLDITKKGRCEKEGILPIRRD